MNPPLATMGIRWDCWHKARVRIRAKELILRKSFSARDRNGSMAFRGGKVVITQEHNKKLDRFRRNEFPNNHFLLDRCLKIVPMHEMYERSRSNFQSRVHGQFNLLEIQIIITTIYLNTRSKSILHILLSKIVTTSIKYFILMRTINNTNHPLFSSVSMNSINRSEILPYISKRILSFL